MINAEIKYEKGIYRQVADATSHETAYVLNELVAGQAVYIPAVAEKDNWLSQQFGQETAQAICDEIANGFGLTVDFPIGQFSERAQRRLLISELIIEGKMSQNEIASATGCSRFTVGRIKKELKKLSNQKTEQKS